MAWSVRAGSVAGIPIRIHATFLLLIAWVAMTYMVSGADSMATLAGVLLVCVVFVAIVIHELAHALVARSFGVKTREILLLPIGGISQMERIPEKPAQELAIALVGPAVNLVIAALLLPFHQPFLVQLRWINLGLALFNLLPAFPMDGGRALRALIALRASRQRATEIAGYVGMAMAIGLALLGLVGNPWLLVIALVVWMGARQEIDMVRLGTAIAHVPVADAMSRGVAVVAPDMLLPSVADLIVRSGRDELPIVDHGTTIGVLTRDDVSVGLSHGAPRVASAPHHDAIVATPDTPLEEVLARMRQSPTAIVVVEDHGTTVGVLTATQLAGYAALHPRP